MTSMDEVLDALKDVDPLWSVALVAVALAVLIGVRLRGASFGRVIALLALLVLVGAAAATGYYGYVHFEELRRLEERRVLDERAETILMQAVQPGSVFACLDGSPAPAMLEACERNLFAEPQRVAASVAIVTQRLAFLADALKFAEARDPSYLTQIEPLRNSLEADAYGFVAYVLSIDHRCTADACDRFHLLRDSSRVRENLRVRRFEAFMAKYAPKWRESSAAPAPATAEQPKESPLPPGEERVSVPGVTIDERGGAPAIADPTSAAVFTAPAGGDAPPPEARETAPAAAPAAAARETPPTPVARPQSTPAKSAQPSAGAKGSTQAVKNSQPKAAAKAKSDPVSRRSSEPVAGLPRVVPGEYAREKPEQAEEPAQASGQEPGSPISIAPQQN